jgi:hypothetical protein
MKPNPIRAAMLAIFLLGTNAASASSPPFTTSIPRADAADRHAIEVLLASYTRCLSEDDEAGFRALLLDSRIPFADVQPSPASIGAPDLRRYQTFRHAVFADGRRYRQRFYHVRIEQHGPLAQVSLIFVTERISGKKKEVATGWKVLQLIKVGGHWKIASELYTF